MGRYKTVDGSPTATITLRLPTWLIEVAGENGNVRDILRVVLIDYFVKRRDGK